MSTRVGVVVVTYESQEVLAPLLDSVAEHEPEATVVVVDNASTSGPPEVGEAELVTLPTNQGYAAACNAGADRLLARDIRYLAFLNPDVRLIGPSLTEIADLLARRRKVGIATGPVVTPSGERIPSAWGPTSVRRALAFAAGLDTARMRSAAGTMLRARVPTSDVSTMVDDMRVEGHVIGGTMVIRAKCFTEVQGFDPGYFLYWEDADLCRRARDAGWEIRVLPVTPFEHTAQDTSSVGVTDKQRWTWFTQGAARYGRRHLVPGQARQLEAALQLGQRLRRLRERG